MMVGGRAELFIRTVRARRRPHGARASLRRDFVSRHSSAFRALSIVLKSDRWWSWKIPPMLAFGYFGLLSGPFDPLPGQFLRHIALFLIAAIGIAGFGHLFTDVFDVEEDRIRGQANLWADSRPLQRWALLAILIAASWIPWLFIPIGRA